MTVRRLRLNVHIFFLQCSLCFGALLLRWFFYSPAKERLWVLMMLLVLFPQPLSLVWNRVHLVVPNGQCASAVRIKYPRWNVPAKSVDNRSWNGLPLRLLAGVIAQRKACKPNRPTNEVSVVFLGVKRRAAHVPERVFVEDFDVVLVHFVLWDVFFTVVKPTNHVSAVAVVQDKVPQRVSAIRRQTHHVKS